MGEGGGKGKELNEGVCEGIGDGNTNETQIQSRHKRQITSELNRKLLWWTIIDFM